MNTTRNFFVTNLFVLCTIVMLVSSGSIISAPNHTKFWTFESFLFKDFLFSISYHSEWLKPYTILFAEFFPGTQKFRTKMISSSYKTTSKHFIFAYIFRTFYWKWMWCQNWNIRLSGVNMLAWKMSKEHTHVMSFRL